MATPSAKRRFVQGKLPVASNPVQVDETAAIEAVKDKMLVVEMVHADTGEMTGPPLTLPASCTPAQLELLLNQLLRNDEPVPYGFRVEDVDVRASLAEDVLVRGLKSAEDRIRICYVPQAVFRVRPVSRCASSLSGHTEAILQVQFSPDGRQLASAGGDTTVRLWDMDTSTPSATLTGHTHWVLCIAWSPDATRLASAGMDTTVRLWDPAKGKAVGDAMKGHRKHVTALAWEPFHANPDAPRLASASKDFTVRIWSSVTRRCELTLSGHTASVTGLRWGGRGWIYTASQDRSVRVWDAARGVLVRSLDAHAHWVNTLSLSVDTVLRTGAFDYHGERPEAQSDAVAAAHKRYEHALAGKDERLVSGSDDFTLFLWDPAHSKKPIARMTGHQKLVNQVAFSPDGRWIASAGFDNCTRLWDGHTGKFVAVLRGHVGAVYQVAFSADSRLVCTGSKDTTLKVWDVRTGKMVTECPGHADEVYAVDWSPACPDGSRVASGGKDRQLKLWRS